MSAASFWFVRHGETEDNRRGVRCGGDRDPPLTALGEQQARTLAQQLLGLDIGVIVTSPLQRTRRTAELIAEAIGGVPVQSEALFIERSLGQWNGLTAAETEASLKAGQTPPGGESEAAFCARVARALESLRPQLQRRPLVVSSRGIARVLHQLTAAPGARWGFPAQPMGNCELFEFHLRREAPDRLGACSPRPTFMAIQGEGP